MKNSSVRQYAITFIPSLIILAIVAIISKIFDVQVSALTQEPNVIGSIHPLYGLHSDLGIVNATT